MSDPRLLLLVPLLALFPAPVQDTAGPPAEDLDRLRAALLQQGIQAEFSLGAVAIPAEICIREELLEYVLVAPHGAAHESLLSTEVQPSVLNAALLALGAVPGTNADWTPREPPPTPEERAAGVLPWDVRVPSGDGFYLYVAWREGAERFFYRLEDLIGDLSRSRQLRRHAFVYLGSRLVRPRPDEPEVFAADVEGNLINLSFFRAGNTLLTAALPECVEQTIWLPNAWLLPPRGTRVSLVLSRSRLDCLPEAFASALPAVTAGEEVERR